MTGSLKGFSTADMRTMRTPLDSLPQRHRLFAGGGRAREIRPSITFRLQTSGDSPVFAADRRSHAVE